MRVRAARAAGVSDTTPWLVVKFGPAVPAGVLRLACLRCGDTNDTALPAKVSDLTNLHDRFKARHEGCKETP